MLRTSIILLCFCVLTSWGAAKSGKKENHLQVPSKPYENSHFLTVDSVQLHYRIWNDTIARPRGKVIFVHGFSGSTFSWRKNIEPLVKAGFRIVAVDLPSFGYSGRYPDLNQSNSNRARLVWLLLQEIDGSDTAGWNVVGHSMGGGVAEAMAILEPGRTRSLTIVDGMIFMKSSNMTSTVSAAGRNKYVNHFMVEMAEKNVITYKRIDKLLKSAYGRVPDSTEVMGYLTPLLIEGTADAAFGIWTHSREIEKMDVETLSTLPVLIIWGSKDKWISKGKGKRFHKALPNSEFKIISGAGHIPMETHTLEFNKILVEFLTK
jgi:2-hydroxy-6-oxonona-2,4-dienedioate hydrolase